LKLNGLPYRQVYRHQKGKRKEQHKTGKKDIVTRQRSSAVDTRIVYGAKFPRSKGKLNCRRKKNEEAGQNKKKKKGC